MSDPKDKGVKGDEQTSFKEDAPLLEHSYDGIQELDNPLPMWWLITFLATIIFSFLYYIHYEITIGPSLDEELSASMKKIEALKAAHGGDGIQADQLGAMATDATAQAKGAEVFNGKCAVCHGNELQGLIGPNLTDHFWIHGKGTPEDIYHVVDKGVPEKGMPPWGEMLSQEEMAQTVAYIMSKKDSNPAGAKAPEGVEVGQ